MPSRGVEIPYLLLSMATLMYVIQGAISTALPKWSCLVAPVVTTSSITLNSKKSRMQCIATHSLGFNSHFPGEPGGSRFLLKQRMTEVVVTTRVTSYNLSSSQIITTNKPTSSFFTSRMPFLSPNQQFQSTERNNITFQRLSKPKLIWGSSNFVSEH